jgi:hypothetical protein
MAAVVIVSPLRASDSYLWSPRTSRRWGDRGVGLEKGRSNQRTISETDESGVTYVGWRLPVALGPPRLTAERRGQKSSSRILTRDTRRSADTEVSLQAGMEERGDESTR